MKTLEITTGFLSEEITLKLAIGKFQIHNTEILGKLKKANPDFVPNQHIYVAHIKNCKSLMKKLQTK